VRPIVTDRVARSVGPAVGLSVGMSLSFCHNVTIVSEPCKTAKPIEMPFGLRTRVGPRNRVLGWSPDPAMGRGNFEGGTAYCKV